MSELTEAIAALELRQASVQRALLADFQAAEAEVEAGGDPGAGWNIADAYRRLFIGMELDAQEVIDRGEAAVLEGAQEIEARSQASLGEPSIADLMRALYLHGFSEAAMLFERRLQAWQTASRAPESSDVAQLRRVVRILSAAYDTSDGARGLLGVVPDHDGLLRAFDEALND